MGTPIYGKTPSSNPSRATPRPQSHRRHLRTVLETATQATHPPPTKHLAHPKYPVSQAEQQQVPPAAAITPHQSAASQLEETGMLPRQQRLSQIDISTPHRSRALRLLQARGNESVVIKSGRTSTSPKTIVRMMSTIR